MPPCGTNREGKSTLLYLLVRRVGSGQVHLFPVQISFSNLYKFPQVGTGELR